MYLTALILELYQYGNFGFTDTNTGNQFELHVSSNASLHIRTMDIATDYILLLNCYTIPTYTLILVNFSNIYICNSKMYLRKIVSTASLQ